MSGYLVWRGDSEFWAVLVVGIVSASAGDNLGYRPGRRLGGPALRRYGRRIWLTSAKLDASQRFVEKYGALAVFVARFLPGLRFAAGPVAGITGLSASVFFIANVLGACLYVPVVVGIGYAVGQRAGIRLEQASSTLLRVEHVVLGAVVVVTIAALLIRVWRHAHAGATGSATEPGGSTDTHTQRCAAIATPNSHDVARPAQVTLAALD